MFKSPQALSKLTVLELGSTIAGPFCGRLLADFGAQVIKVEDPAGDVLRSMGEIVNGKSLHAASLLRNKLVVAADMRTPGGRDVVKRLAAKSDILIENFRPGALEKWGLGYDELAKLNRGLVMVRISGYGQTGPYSARPGYGVVSEATSGLRYINGYPEAPPARMGTPLTDYVTGLYAAFGALVALVERGVSGEGQVIDAALYESAFSFMESFVPAYDKLGLVPERTGSKLPGAAPNNLYVTADKQYILIAAWADSLFRRLCIAMAMPQLADDPRFDVVKARAKNTDELDDIITGWTLSRDLAEIEQILATHEIPASRIFSMADIFKDPHYRARQAIVRVKDEALTDVALAAPVPRLSRTPGEIQHAGHAKGQDTVAVLSRFGFTPQEIDALIHQGAVHVS
ncbi:MAG TPA: CaiB/BaiF CoA-transferase family protein [Burkholderiaceae bacterium]|jgi:crotonobetainyl-CoA:carnitine CoA-transferase CaiB-like acyl-CoA transferase